MFPTVFLVDVYLCKFFLVIFLAYDELLRFLFKTSCVMQLEFLMFWYKEFDIFGVGFLRLMNDRYCPLRRFPLCWP